MACIACKISHSENVNKVSFLCLDARAFGLYSQFFHSYGNEESLGVFTYTVLYLHVTGLITVAYILPSLTYHAVYTLPSYIILTWTHNRIMSPSSKRDSHQYQFFGLIRPEFDFLSANFEANARSCPLNLRRGPKEHNKEQSNFRTFRRLCSIRSQQISPLIAN